MELCVGKQSGQPLKRYSLESDALDAVVYVKRTHGKEMKHYLCHICGFFHLSPLTRETPSQLCAQCFGGDGRNKEAYLSEEYARIRASIILNERGIRLESYPCPYGNGWHLTKG